MCPRHWLLSGSLILMGACAQPGPPAPQSSAAGPEVLRTIAQHRQLALQYQQSGDLAAASAQWQILTLLDPRDEASRRGLATTQATINRIVTEQLQAGTTAMRNGETERAAQAMLKVLTADPNNAQAAKALRDMEKQKLTGIQAQRAARARQEEGAMENRAPRPAPQPQPTTEAGNGYDVEQGLEMFKAGDVAGGLRELRRFVEANPGNQSARQRIGAAVFERGQALEREGAREQALPLYEQAIQLRGDAAPGWEARVQALRSVLGEEYYQKGIRSYRDDIALAIKQWEKSLSFDPGNVKAAARLREARQVQRNLERIPQQ